MNTIDAQNFSGKKVLVRVDFNVPLDADRHITDDTRMREALPTIKKLLSDGAAVIIMAHLGRPKKGGFEPEFSLKPVAEHLSEMLSRKVIFSQELLSENTEKMCREMHDGEVMLLENIRFYPEETKGDAKFAERLASLGDAYVNDAFGCAHREHASTATIARYFKGNSYFGYLMQHEVENLRKLMSAEKRPFTAIIGGSKVSTKIGILTSLLDKVDNLIIGGGMTYTFLRAKGINTANSITEEDKLDVATEIMKKAEEKGVKLYLPIDTVVGNRFANDAETLIADNTKDYPAGYEGMDAGPKTRELFTEVILASQTILWNGPVGVFEFENFAKGTNAIAEAVAKASDKGAFSAIGGGDSVSAANKSGYADKMSFISTGGGAMLEYIEGREMPGIKAIEG